MTDIENPPSFIARTELRKAAFENGFRLDQGHDGGWLHFHSTTAPGEIRLAATSARGRWLLALSLEAVAREMRLPSAREIVAPLPATFSFETLEDLHTALDRVYRLSVSLPDAPLQQFLSATAAAPRSTEAERLVIQRVGQEIFRAALMKYWNGRCPLTGITDPALLRASHIVPWSECQTDPQRLDVHNGLLLSALWDAAFDAGLISFDDRGCPLYSPALTGVGARLLNIQPVNPLILTATHRDNLIHHRTKHGFLCEK